LDGRTRGETDMNSGQIGIEALRFQLRAMVLTGLCGRLTATAEP
jgi:hypothetical protein